MSTLHWITAEALPDDFPSPEMALTDPDGLLASGGDLSVARLLAAYRRGIFPWYDSGQPVLWWSPNPRAFLPADKLHISKSLRRSLRRVPYELSFDQDFHGVINACAAPRRDEPLTWILPEMIEAYCALHAAGHAHSFEVRVDGELVGGIYGVAIGRMFCAESMFSRISDASKIAVAMLIWQLADWGFPGIDCQVPSAHLQSLGCVSMPRSEFLSLNKHYQALSGPPAWEFDQGIKARHLGTVGSPESG
ncbi:MAG: leucyl/phenylalanyl-tRNA--protein transferase [Gammaproteobacteria bacterium]|nr:leucyl/phenylalanyl-tRNA--protein transferase [Gammaproteobacteria bacterium]